MKKGEYRLSGSQFGKLKPGDMTIVDPLYGLVYVVATKKIAGLEFPAVQLTLEARSLAFSREQSEHSDIRYQVWSTLHWANSGCMRATVVR